MAELTIQRRKDFGAILRRVIAGLFASTGLFLFAHARHATSTELQAPCSSGNMLQDSSFEASTDNAGTITNPFWNSSSTVFGSSLCNLAECGDGGGSSGPRSGSYWVWVGGTDGPDAATVTQVATIPA